MRGLRTLLVRKFDTGFTPEARHHTDKTPLIAIVRVLDGSTRMTSARQFVASQGSHCDQSSLKIFL